jgi:hypothetical protein
VHEDRRVARDDVVGVQVADGEVIGILGAGLVRMSWSAPSAGEPWRPFDGNLTATRCDLAPFRARRRVYSPELYIYVMSYVPLPRRSEAYDMTAMRRWRLSTS